MTGTPSRLTLSCSSVSPPALERAGQDDGVAVDLGGRGGRRQGSGLEGAGHGEVGAEDVVLAVGARHEVGEQPPAAGGQVERRRPDAVVAEHRVHVLEAGEVAADGDQVQVLVVGDVERGDRRTVGVEDAEGDGRPVPAGTASSARSSV